MALAASATTKALSVTAICRLNLLFRPSSASYIDWLKDRSFLALGRMRAILSAFVVGAPDVPGAALVAGADVVAVVFDELLLHAVAIRVAPTTSGTSHRALDMTDRMADLLVGFM